MIKTIFDKIAKFGPFLYLFGPYLFFVGFYDGVNFVTFPALVSLLGILTIILVVAWNISTTKFTVTRSDWVIFAITVYFLLTALLSEHPLLSVKRWVLIIVIGTAFYALGRLSPKPVTYLIKPNILCGSSILVLLIFALVIFIFGESYYFHIFGEDYYRMGYPEGSYIIPLFENLYVGQTYGGHFIGNFYLRRPSSLFSNPNGVAIFALLTLAITTFNWNKRSTWQWLVLIATVVLLLWTASRAALLGSAIFFLSYQFCINARFRRFIPIVIAAVIILPLALYIYILNFPQPEQWDNFFELLQLRERGSGWKIALENFSPKLWLTGAGFGIVQEAVLEPNNFIFSIWIALLLETGIIGVSLVFLLSVMSLNRCYSSIRECKEGSQVQKVNAVIFSLLLALLFHQAFDLSVFRFHPLNFFLFSLFGLAANPKLKTVDPSE